MLVVYRDIVTALRPLSLNRVPVLAHVSLSAFGEVRGGVDTMLGALISSVGGLMMPAFTYNTMIIPEEGPEDNGIAYGSGHDLNRMAEFYQPDMPVDKMMGETAEALRKYPQAVRSMHPVLSFSGLGVDAALHKQTLCNPLAPIGALAEQGGWILLMGVDQRVNTSIHYAEKLAGRKQFTRWALTSSGIAEFAGFPGCSLGFEKAASLLRGISHTATIGSGRVIALPMQPTFIVIKQLLFENPLALLCDLPDCERCNAVRAEVAAIRPE